MRKEQIRWELYPSKYEASFLKWDVAYLEQVDQFKKRIAPAKTPEAVRDLGMKLRNERVSRGITLEDVCGWTRIPKKHLEAIESGALSELPGGIYVKSFVKQYADYISFDQAVVNRAFALSGEKAANVLDVFLPNVAAHAREARFDVNDHASRLPKFGEFLLYFFLSQAERVNVIGDLAEEYDSISAKFGVRAAKLYFYRQVSVSLSPFVGKFMLRLLATLIEAILLRRG
jgi:hypothetical protein